MAIAMAIIIDIAIVMSMRHNKFIEAGSDLSELCSEHRSELLA